MRVDAPHPGPVSCRWGTWMHPPPHPHAPHVNATIIHPHTPLITSEGGGGVNQDLVEERHLRPDPHRPCLRPPCPRHWPCPCPPCPPHFSPCPPPLPQPPPRPMR